MKKLKNSIFEMSVIRQNLNINNLRTTTAKVYQPAYHYKACLIFLRKCSARVMFALLVFEMLLSQGRSILRPTQQGTWRERVSKYGCNFDDVSKICYNRLS